MKAVKLIGALLAVAFVLLHLAEVPQAMSLRSGGSGQFDSSWWIGKGTAILVGLLIAATLCRSALRKSDPVSTWK